MTDAEVIAALTDRQALGLTAWAEARGDRAQGNSSVEERIAVMWVCKNRVIDPAHRWPRSFRGVCLEPSQFSCWNPAPDPNHAALLLLAAKVVGGMPSDDPLADETLYLADGVIGGELLDRTGGATQYYAPAAMIPAGRVPGWAIRAGHEIPATAVIGSQRFYRL